MFLFIYFHFFYVCFIYFYLLTTCSKVVIKAQVVSIKVLHLTAKK